MCKNSIIFVILATFPIDLLAAAVFQNMRVIPVLRLFKLIHTGNLPLYFSPVRDYLQLKILMSFEVSRFLLLYYFLFMLCHWVGCAFRLVGSASVHIFACATNWMEVDSSSTSLNENYDALAHTTVYWRSIYWAVGVMSLKSFPDIIARNSVEIMFSIFVMFLGCQVNEICV